MIDIFDHYADRDVSDLIGEYPLAWLCARDGRAEHASLLPLLAECDAAGGLTHLVGHMARRNPLFEALSADCRALVLFNGPGAYVSPEHAQVRNWAPTWNFAQLRIEAEIVFEPEQTDAALDLLVTAMEVDRPAPWQPPELGERYAQMRTAIIAFRARVTTVRGRFKLGQDESPDVLRAILENLPDPAMTRWMRRFNTGRI